MEERWINAYERMEERRRGKNEVYIDICRDGGDGGWKILLELHRISYISSLIQQVRKLHW